jgi:hypothetical protein
VERTAAAEPDGVLMLSEEIDPDDEVLPAAFARFDLTWG